MKRSHCSGSHSPSSRGGRLLLVAGALLLGWTPSDRCIADDPRSPPAGLEERYEGNITVEALSGRFVQPPPVPSEPLEITPEAAEGPAEPPSTAEGLFGLDEAAEPGTAEGAETAAELFGFAEPREAPGLWSGRITGFFQNELAFTYPDPDHFSKAKNILRLRTEGRLTDRIKWRAGGHIAYDPVYDFSDFYPSAVKEDQKFDAYAEETFVDISAGAWDLRLGRQHVVWGEAVGLFFADVVSALDLREFVLPDFELIRIPQWAARAEYFSGNFHGEALWIPFMTFNEIGEPGADFFPFPPPPPPGFAAHFENERTPSDAPENSAGGVRFSYLRGGWDTALFYYTSMDRDPAFERRIVSSPTPAFVFRPIHERIHQVGATLGKDVGPAVLSAEVVYTMDKLFSVTRITEEDGLVRQDVLDYILGLDYVFREHTLNFQLFQRYFPDHDPDMVPSELETGFSIRAATGAVHPDVEPEILWLFGIDEQDWLLQPKITWTFHPSWRAVLGADIFGGPRDALFGRFKDNDRVYYEVRFTF